MKIVKRAIILLFSLLFISILLNFLYPLDIERLNRVKSTTIYDKKGQLLAVKLSSDEFLRIP